jgi:hypothetical protein
MGSSQADDTIISMCRSDFNNFSSFSFVFFFFLGGGGGVGARVVRKKFINEQDQVRKKRENETSY